jgi:Sulfotransferase domain
MKYNIIVATHHKTGTVWMSTVFKAIARDVSAEYVDFWSQRGQLAETLRTPFLLFNYHSDFREHAHILSRDDVRILHLIRDPRDVLISAMHYHKKSNETWLHEPVPGYDNVTYQRRLSTLATRFEQYVFEMENSTNSTLRDMLEWQYGRTNCFEARYEDLRQDTQMAYWSKITAFLGFDGAEQEICRQLFWKNSLFGSLVGFGHKHIRSGDVAQWKREFTPRLANAFLERFPTALQSLKYETDNRWALELQGTEGAGLASVLKRLIGKR